MYNVLEFNKDFKKMYKNNLIKLFGLALDKNHKNFEMGDINASSGQNSEHDSRVILVNYLGVKPNSKYLIKSNVGNIGLRFYNKNKNYLSPRSTDARQAVFDTPKDCYYIRFILVTTELKFNRVIIEPLKISQNLKIDLTFETGSINYSTGQNQNMASTLRTDFIEVQENEKYKIRYYNSNIVYGLRCYDKDKNYLKPDEITSNIITIPTGTHFIRIIRKDTSKPDEFLERI